MCETTNDAYTKAIEYLKTSPMFNLSLSSKELFHSNFLYWIWKLDSTAFKCLIAKLLNVSPDDLKWGNEWEVAREYNSFDLCVKYRDTESNNEETGARKIRYGDVLLVIENKVKSIPYKAQLKKYVDKVNELYGKRRKGDAGNVKYILLTLPTHFPNAPKKISSEGKNSPIDNWKIVTYEKYIKILKELKISSSDGLDEQAKVYASKIIDDYIKFVEHLLVIYQVWTVMCYDKLGFIYYDEQKKQCSEYLRYITDAQKLRIHDLYHKSKYARICADIISRFGGENIHIDGYEVGINLTDKAVCKYLEEEGNKKKSCIVWEYNYTHGEPLVGVKIARRDKDGNLITYIIQVQSGVYEHGVIADHSKLKGCEGVKAEKLWDYIRNKSTDNIFSVGGYPWLRSEDFADATKGSELSNPRNVLVPDNIFVMDCLYPVTLPYAKYASDNSNTAMIYQFRKLKFDVETKDLIEYIIRDVTNLLEGLNKQQ